MLRSHQTFHPVPAVKLLGITFRTRCWPTTFHTITAGDADGRMVSKVAGVISPLRGHYINISQQRPWVWWAMGSGDYTSSMRSYFAYLQNSTVSGCTRSCTWTSLRLLTMYLKSFSLLCMHKGSWAHLTEEEALIWDRGCSKLNIKSRKSWY
jgi:hypothetical protein